MNAVVVEAELGYRDSDDGWLVLQGDLGVLTWIPHKRYHQLFEFRVVWDRDPERKVRQIIESSITIIGLQTQAARILLALPPS